MGPISTLVDLETVAPEIKSGLHRYCPEHTVQLKQQYQCSGTIEQAGHPVQWGEWAMGQEGADGVVKVVNEGTRPKIEAAAGLTLVPVPRTDLEAATFEGEGVYYAKPSNNFAEQTWVAFNKLVSGDMAFIAKGALRNGGVTEKLWRLTTFNGYLVLRDIRFPENVKETPSAPSAEVDDATFELVNKFVDGLKTDWSDFDSTDSGTARLQAWINDGVDAESGAAAVAVPTMDLKAILEAALADA